MALVRTRFHTNAAEVIHLGAGQAVRHIHHNDNALISRHILGNGMQRRLHLLAGDIAENLVQVPHIGSIQPGNAAAVIHAEKKLKVAWRHHWVLAARRSRAIAWPGLAERQTRRTRNIAEKCLYIMASTSPRMPFASSSSTAALRY